MKRSYVSFIVLTFFCLVSCGKKIETDSAMTHDTSLVQESHESIESSPSSSNQESTDLKETSDSVDELATYLEQFSGENIGIYIEEIETGKSYGVNENNIMYGASIAKLPIIYYTQLQLLANQVSMDDTFLYIDSVNDIPGAMIRGGTGIMQQQVQENSYVTLSQLLSWTICYSDNLANNMLGYYVADKNSGHFLESISKFYPEPLSVYTKDLSAKTAGELMKEIYKNNIGISDFLHTQWQKEKIGSLDVPVYHKIGTNESYNHDVGIVMEEKPYVFSILTNGYSNDEIEKIVKYVNTLMKKRSE